MRSLDAVIVSKAHVVTGNKETASRVQQALANSGLPVEAMNVVVVPSDLGLYHDVVHLGGQVRVGTHYETVLRR